MSIPKAVSPTFRVPGLYLLVNLLAGVVSPGAQTRKAIILATKSSSGDLTDGTELRDCFSEADASTGFGPGTQGHLAAKSFFKAYPQGRLVIGSIAESSGVAAAGTLTFAGTITVSGATTINVCGRDITFASNAGESGATIATRAAAAVSAFNTDIPITCAVDGSVTSQINFTAKTKGLWGNDVWVKATTTATGQTLTTGSITSNLLTGGTLEPSVATVLTTMSTQKFKYIIPCLSNTEVVLGSGTTNSTRIKTHINTYNTGSQAKLQQAVVGDTSTDALAKTGAIYLNEATIERPHARKARSLPCELAAFEAGDRLRQLDLGNFNPNRIGTVMLGIYAADDLITNTPSDNELNDSLSNGVAATTYTSRGEVVMVRPITSHSQDTGGNNDVRAFDCNEVDAVYEYAEDIQVSLPQEFTGAKVTPDQTSEEDQLPEGVIEERDIKAFIVSRTLEFWCPKGVLQRAKFEAAVLDGSLIVKVDSIDPTQVNIVIPASPFKILAKLGVVVNKV